MPKNKFTLWAHSSARIHGRYVQIDEDKGSFPTRESAWKHGELKLGLGGYISRDRKRMLQKAGIIYTGYSVTPISQR